MFIGATWKILDVMRLTMALPAPLAFLLLLSAALGGGVILSRQVEMRLMRWIRGGGTRLPQAALP